MLQMEADAAARRKEAGIKHFYNPEFTMREVCASFSSSNLDSDWESMDFFTLDTEMVLMEYIEGLSRMAFRRYVKKHPDHREEPDEKTFAETVDKFLADCCARFPHWPKYQSMLDDINLKGWKSKEKEKDASP